MGIGMVVGAVLGAALETGTDHVFSGLSHLLFGERGGRQNNAAKKQDEQLASESSRESELAKETSELSTRGSQLSIRMHELSSRWSYQSSKKRMSDLEWKCVKDLSLTDVKQGLAQQRIIEDSVEEFMKKATAGANNNQPRRQSKP